MTAGFNDGDWYPLFEVVWGVVHVLLGLVGITSNIYVIIIYPSLRRVTATVCRVMVVIAIGDVVNSAVALYSGIFLALGRPQLSSRDKIGFTLCKVAGFLFNAVSIATPCFLATISFIRFLGMYKKGRYFRKLSHTSIPTVWLGVIFLYATLVSSSTFMLGGDYYFHEEWTICDYFLPDALLVSKAGIVLYDTITMIIPIYVPLACVVTFNACIARSIFTSRMALRKAEIRSPYHAGGKHSGVPVRQTEKIILHLGLVSLSYMVCYGTWLGYYTSVLLEDLELLPYDYQVRVGKNTWRFLMTWYCFAAYVNSALMPLIHFISSQEFRDRCVEVVQTFARNMLYFVREV